MNVWTQFHDSPSNSCRDRTLPSYAANMSSLPVVTFNHYVYFHSSIVIPLHSATTNTQLAPSDWDGCDHVTAHYWTTFSFQFKARNQRRLSLRITLHKPELQLQFVCDVQSSAYFEIVSIVCLIFYRDTVSEVYHHEHNNRCITASVEISLALKASVQFGMIHFKSALLFEREEICAVRVASFKVT